MASAVPAASASLASSSPSEAVPVAAAAPRPSRRATTPYCRGGDTSASSQNSPGHLSPVSAGFAQERSYKTGGAHIVDWGKQDQISKPCTYSLVHTIFSRILHEQVFKQTERRDDRRFLYVFGGHRYLMISFDQIDDRETAAAAAIETGPGTGCLGGRQRGEEVASPPSILKGGGRRGREGPTGRKRAASAFRHTLLRKAHDDMVELCARLCDAPVAERGFCLKEPHIWIRHPEFR
jgi:hypothetical protein